jgi:hypothetical protein
MKALAKEILRWCVIAASGGFGVWQLVDTVWHVATRWDGDWSDLLFCLILVPAVLVAPFLAVAYFCLRRQYRKLFLVLGGVGAIAIFFGLTALPRELHLHELMHRHIRENPGLAFLGLPLSLLSMFVPIFAAAWFFRLCQRWAYPRQPGGEGKSPTKTRATYWLVWSGVLLLLLSPFVGAVSLLRSVMQPPAQATLPESSMGNWLLWTMTGMTFGALLLFLGLVRRRPVRDVAEMEADHPAQSVSASIR